MLRPRRIRHFKNNILQTRGLRRRPMDSRCARSGRNGSEIDDEIADLPPEHIRRWGKKGRQLVKYHLSRKLFKTKKISRDLKHTTKTQYSSRITRFILIPIDDSKPRKSRFGFQNGQIVRIADQLGIVIIQNRRRNQISPRWEINNGGFVTSRAAFAGRAAIAIGNGFLYGCCVICHAVSGSSQEAHRSASDNCDSFSSLSEWNREKRQVNQTNTHPLAP